MQLPELLDQGISNTRVLPGELPMDWVVGPEILALGVTQEVSIGTFPNDDCQVFFIPTINAASSSCQGKSLLNDQIHSCSACVSPPKGRGRPSKDQRYHPNSGGSLTILTQDP